MIRKYEKKLTPSGMWDNGLWFLSKNTVEFPACKIKEAIIETVQLKSGSGYMRGDGNSYFNALRVTIDSHLWYVNQDPRGNK